MSNWNRATSEKMAFRGWWVSKKDFTIFSYRRKKPRFPGLHTYLIPIQVHDETRFRYLSKPASQIVHTSLDCRTRETNLVRVWIQIVPGLSVRGATNNSERTSLNPKCGRSRSKAKNSYLIDYRLLKTFRDHFGKYSPKNIKYCETQRNE